MRLITRIAFVAAAAVPLTSTSFGQASAAEPTEVSYAYTVGGSTVSNTITNNSGSVLHCATSLSPAPGGVLPPVEDVIRNGQTLFDSGDVAPGTTTQSVTDIPDGSYVVLATCSRSDNDPAMWVSAYPGIEEVLKQFPSPAFTVQEASHVVTIPGVGSTPPATGGLPDLLESLFGTGSAN